MNIYSHIDLGVEGNMTAISGYVEAVRELYVPVNSKYILVYIIRHSKYPSRYDSTMTVQHKVANIELLNIQRIEQVAKGALLPNAGS
jgi:hypothetical protein